MTTQTTVLVTGVAGYWGSRLAARLLDLPGHSVIGLDVEQPTEELEGLDFIQADVRNPLLVDLLKAEAIDTVCHLAFIDAIRPTEAAFDLNVMGAMKVIGACTEASVRKIVLKSSMAVYGARPGNPAFLTEDHPLRGSRKYGYTRDMVEIEAFCEGFRRQTPEMSQTILRFASIIGPTVNTPMTRFLSKPWAPTLWGFDPRMQLIHEDDVVEALVHAVLHETPGVFNVAAEDVLPLNRIRGVAGKTPLPILHPFAYLGAALLRSTGLRLTRYVPIELDYIRYPWVGDLTKMREELGFQPRYTAEEALREFSARNRLPRSARPARGEDRLRDVIERRHRAREQRRGGEDE
ncbi:MAG: SDR family oxidoreductase [Anaerolineae bacterium]|jgi:UDP-glucose 4-epimerase